jgi:hypothetical protein
MLDALAECCQRFLERGDEPRGAELDFVLSPVKRLWRWRDREKIVVFGYSAERAESKSAKYHRATRIVAAREPGWSQWHS